MSRGLYRALNTLLLIGASSILVVAAWLEPDPSGVGTHLQLGLDGCVILSLFELPCPMCGMTTTFALMADRQWLAAIKNQPFGVVLFFMTVFTAIVSAFEVIDPRSRWAATLDRFNGAEVTFVVAFFGLMMAAWAYKIFSMRIFLAT